MTKPPLPPKLYYLPSKRDCNLCQCQLRPVRKQLPICTNRTKHKQKSPVKMRVSEKSQTHWKQKININCSVFLWFPDTHNLRYTHKHKINNTRKGKKPHPPKTTSTTIIIIIIIVFTFNPVKRKPHWHPKHWARLGKRWKKSARS